VEPGQGVFDDGSYPVVVACVWSSSLLLNVVALPLETLSRRRATRGVYGYSPGSLSQNRIVCLRAEFIFGVERFGIDIIIILQASVCSLRRDLWLWASSWEFSASWSY